LLPDTPSFGEISPGFFVGTILGLAAPARTPRPIVERLNREIAKVVNTDTMRERLATMANKARAGSPEDFTETVAQYVARWNGVIEKLGIAR
jgi:tripartite-type tricarboxylate transporter receptor subunit TctC